ncbi:2-phospho-L-lactate guanylyltransferase [Zhongshania aliphaticivorans]|uniref:2-phospho-L-lactate guanylyltransferase n=1 Tax=Zhongshania aliphaticivorans TaxID=1470434 RepID=A0A5S9NW58_9GAMM|nr:TIGR04282 family arsenosugar biosynthesis glycosyltransferase [Zhongshania aliphaticivorans]CAA0094897.1 2-phospho-L-lactate guanylyltransferase [Zhongshania aliphaticivorans]CAA0112744.1 2-phospho-L-lactate guanylyltransferase [Zhongshania aliphaticivorans]
MTSAESSRLLRRIGIQVIAKAPVAGLAKTRLIPALGAHGAAALAKKMLVRMLGHCEIAVEDSEHNYQFFVNLWMTPAPDSPSWRDIVIPSCVELHGQCSGDLGERMSFAVRHGLANVDAVLVIGSDCLEIDVEVLHWAASALKEHDACLVPCVDGGYALLGMRHFRPEVFHNISWSSASVADQTRQRLDQCGMSYIERHVVRDIDDAEDLAYLPPEWPEYDARSPDA